MADKDDPDRPAGGETRSEREARLARALRDNLRRRKAAPPPPPQKDGLAD